MARVLVGPHQNASTGQMSTKHLINQAITHSIIKADTALKNEHYIDAHKFYKYALRLCEMQFGQQDSMVKNLSLLIKGIDDFLKQGAQKSIMVSESN